ncbi:MAG: hypothetical protein WC915_02895 [archaeon]|jgi:hypothetical protein
MNKGFVLSFEAALTLILFSLILLSVPQPKTESFTELIILQQENDLLKIWSKDYSPLEMIKDIKTNFTNASLFIDEIQLVNGNITKNSIASEGVLLDLILIEHKVRIVVYY